MIHKRVDDFSYGWSDFWSENFTVALFVPLSFITALTVVSAIVVLD